MPISFFQLASCYVVVWSPREKRCRVESFSDMFYRNLTFFDRQQLRASGDWILIGFSPRRAGAEYICRRADQKLLEPSPRLSKETEAGEGPPAEGLWFFEP